MMSNLPNMDWITPLGLPTIFATYDEKLPKLDLYESGSRVYLKVHNPCYAAYHPDVRCFDEVTYSPLQLPDRIKTFIRNVSIAVNPSGRLDKTDDSKTVIDDAERALPIELFNSPFLGLSSMDFYTTMRKSKTNKLHEVMQRSVRAGF